MIGASTNSHALFICNNTPYDGYIGLAHNKRIMRDRPASDALTRAPTGIDHQFVAVARDRVGAGRSHFQRPGWRYLRPQRPRRGDEFCDPYTPRGGVGM